PAFSALIMLPSGEILRIISSLACSYTLLHNKYMPSSMTGSNLQNASSSKIVSPFPTATQSSPAAPKPHSSETIGPLSAYSLFRVTVTGNPQSKLSTNSAIQRDL